MQIARRRISVLLLIVTLLSLLPRAEASAMTRAVPAPPTEARLAPLPPAAPPARPAEAHSTGSVMPGPTANLPAALPPPSLRFEFHATGFSNTNMKVQTPAGILLGKEYMASDSTGGVFAGTYSSLPKSAPGDHSL